MNIFFRVDASLEIGSGHIMRCLTLAEIFIEKGYNVRFICRKLEGSMEDIIKKRGFKVNLLSEIPGNLTEWMNVNWKQDAVETKKVILENEVDLLIIDHYSIDVKWEKFISRYVKEILLIDDFRGNKHYCDILLDPSYGAEKSQYLYDIENNERVDFLLGTYYSLIRKEISDVEKIKNYDPNSRKIHIFFGGMDKRNYTLKYSELLLRYIENIKLVIVVGDKYEYINSLNQLKLKFNGSVEVYQNVENMGELMKECSLAIGAPGTTTWERATIGLPALYVATSQNQIPILQKLQEDEICAFLGDVDYLKDSEFIKKVKKHLDKTEEMDKFSRKGKLIVNENGAKEIVDYLEQRWLKNGNDFFENI